jgi:hypothetical protein
VAASGTKKRSLLVVQYSLTQRRDINIRNQILFMHRDPVTAIYIRLSIYEGLRIIIASSPSLEHTPHTIPKVKSNILIASFS